MYKIIKRKILNLKIIVDNFLNESCFFFLDFIVKIDYF